MTIKSKKILHIISELKDQYLLQEDFNKPWIIGFSGGKDSTWYLPNHFIS